MQIGNILNNTMSNLSLNNNHSSNGSIYNAVLPQSGKNTSPHQKMLLQLQEQIKKIKDSDAPEDEKSTQIKALEEQIAQLKEQIAQEQLEKSTQNQKEKDHEKEDVTTEQLEEKGFYVIGNDFVQSFVSASGSMKLASTAHTQYVAAKGRHDEVAMAKSLGYQASFTQKAQNSMEDIEVTKSKESTESEEYLNNDKNTMETQNSKETYLAADDEAENSGGSEFTALHKESQADRTTGYVQTGKKVTKKDEEHVFEISI